MAPVARLFPVDHPGIGERGGSDRSIAQLLREKQPQHDQLIGCEAARSNLQIAAKVVNKHFLNLPGILMTGAKIAPKRRMMSGRGTNSQKHLAAGAACNSATLLDARQHIDRARDRLGLLAIKGSCDAGVVGTLRRDRDLRGAEARDRGDDLSETTLVLMTNSPWTLGGVLFDASGSSVGCSRVVGERWRLFAHANLCSGLARLDDGLAADRQAREAPLASWPAVFPSRPAGLAFLRGAQGTPRHFVWRTHWLAATVDRDILSAPHRRSPGFRAHVRNSHAGAAAILALHFVVDEGFYAYRD